MALKKRVAVLGATGSIGKSSLDIIKQNSGKFDIVLLSANSNRTQLKELSLQYPEASCVLTEEENGKDKLLNAIKNANADITINGISGAAGLEPSLAAINSGSNLALANKETIVMAGNLVLNLANKKNVKIIPVDSEHSAIFHLLKKYSQDSYCEHGQTLTENNKDSNNLVSEIILTASGGPFRNLLLEEMERVTAKDALDHPTWMMGPKITIDSASMANKGLEIIEACHFFGLPPEKIKVVIHPQSIVHSMIRLYNGVFYAQLSKPDMRHPIHDAIFWPETAPSALEPLNFDSLTLEFSKPDTKKFPMIDIAYIAARRGGLYPCAYNAANEVAVAAFLGEKIKFLDIPRITEHVMQTDWTGDCGDLQIILNADKEARLKANLYLK